MKRCLWKDEDGMTLVELLAALAAGTLLLLLAGKIWSRMDRMFVEQQQIRVWSQSVDGIINYIEGTLIYADSLEISYEKKAVPDDTHVLMVDEEGRLLADGKPVYKDTFYGNKRLSLHVDLPAAGESDDVFSYTLYVKDKKSRTFYSERSVIQLINLKPAGRSIVYPDESGEIMNSDTHSIWMYYTQAVN